MQAGQGWEVCSDHTWGATLASKADSAVTSTVLEVPFRPLECELSTQQHPIKAKIIQRQFVGTKLEGKMRTDFFGFPEIRYREVKYWKAASTLSSLLESQEYRVDGETGTKHFLSL